MIRFWFNFDFSNCNEEPPPGVRYGCGITAYSYEQAIFLLNEKVFRNQDIPNTFECIENVDISTLDQGHVIPNMKAPIFFGIWFPIGYD
ncbi:MAG: hypothetical protein R2798_01105 [Chitinophagales bacterium]|nr:hypothetical protein [Bacteroidota bacterium]MCB9042999.1 hypothetical protein [Chitinophagales bacterium]